jgi:hypothetical protein
MATVKYYNSGTSQWEPILYGAQGDTGATGATGATNSLSIGTVTNGLTAGASITGSAPSQTLNLVLPLNANAVDADSIQSLTNKTLVSPAFTGTPTAPLATTGTNTTQVATTSFVQQELNILTTGAPAALNTLDELAAALGDDANYAASITTALGTKAPLISPTFTTPVIGSATGTSLGLTVSSGSTVPLTIQNNGTGNSFVVNDVASDTTPLVIDQTGRLLIGTATSNGPDIEVVNRNGVNGTIATRSSSATDSASVMAQANTFYSTPSYITTSMIQYGASATGTTSGLANASLGNLVFQNTNNALIHTNGATPIVFGTTNIERMRIAADGTTTINAIADATTTTAARGAGYMGVPPSAAATTGAYTIVAADAGEHIYSTATRTVTIPANASVAFPVGTAITFIAATGTTVTIAITTDTLLLAGPGTTGSRTLAPFGMATAIKITSTSWIISGNGLT